MSDIEERKARFAELWRARLEGTASFVAPEPRHATDYTGDPARIAFGVQRGESFGPNGIDLLATAYLKLLEQVQAIGRLLEQTK